LYEERRLMIEKGMTPPPIVMDEGTRSPDDSLPRGTIMMFLGIGLGLGYFVLQTGTHNGVYYVIRVDSKHIELATAANAPAIAALTAPVAGLGPCTAGSHQ